jgi:hypothetical protein
MPSSLSARLATVDPFTIYAFCLRKLEDKYETHEHPELTQVIEFPIFIAYEIFALQEIDNWPRHVPDVEELI